MKARKFAYSETRYLTKPINPLISEIHNGPVNIERISVAQITPSIYFRQNEIASGHFSLLRPPLRTNETPKARTTCAI